MKERKEEDGRDYVLWRWRRKGIDRERLLIISLHQAALRTDMAREREREREGGGEGGGGGLTVIDKQTVFSRQ